MPVENRFLICILLKKDNEIVIFLFFLSLSFLFFSFFFFFFLILSLWVHERHLCFGLSNFLIFYERYIPHMFYSKISQLTVIHCLFFCCCFLPFFSKSFKHRDETHTKVHSILWKILHSFSLFSFLIMFLFFFFNF